MTNTPLPSSLSLSTSSLLPLPLFFSPSLFALLLLCPKTSRQALERELINASLGHTFPHSAQWANSLAWQPLEGVGEEAEGGSFPLRSKFAHICQQLSGLSETSIAFSIGKCRTRWQTEQAASGRGLMRGKGCVCSLALLANCIVHAPSPSHSHTHTHTVACSLPHFAGNLMNKRAKHTKLHKKKLRIVNVACGWEGEGVGKVRGSR